MWGIFRKPAKVEPLPVAPDLPPYSEECPKCKRGATSAGIFNYCIGDGPRCGIRREHIHHKCIYCGAPRVTRCADG